MFVTTGAGSTCSPRNHDAAPGDTQAALTGTRYPQPEIATEPRRIRRSTARAPVLRVWAVLAAHASNGCGLHLLPAQIRNLSEMNTYAKCAANPCGMRTSKIIGLKVSCNEHFQKNGGREGFGCGLYLQPTQTIVTQRLPPLVAQNKGPADKIDTKTSCAVCFKDRYSE
jgi:hypothetical protein